MTTTETTSVLRPHNLYQCVGQYSTTGDFRVTRNPQYKQRYALWLRHRATSNKVYENVSSCIESAEEQQHDSPQPMASRLSKYIRHTECSRFLARGLNINRHGRKYHLITLIEFTCNFPWKLPSKFIERGEEFSS